MGYWPASSSPARFLSAGSCCETSAAKIRAADQVMTALPAMPAAIAGSVVMAIPGITAAVMPAEAMVAAVMEVVEVVVTAAGVAAIEARQLGPVD
jgi:hypothetical protein